MINYTNSTLKLPKNPLKLTNETITNYKTILIIIYLCKINFTILPYGFSSVPDMLDIPFQANPQMITCLQVTDSS